jgi:MOSC domain-containing protein YiiM
LAFKDRRFQIGEAVLEMTGDCHPCSKMEENLGSGGYNAMRGHGGITAKIVKGGMIKIGDSVQLIPR